MQKLFARVTEMVEDESGFVVVLIGELGPYHPISVSQADTGLCV